MTAPSNPLETTHSPWPHRMAAILACATFPLIWVGGLVTTYDAGMAVPDWPNTYGYNLFLYPLSTWLSGPWDLFIEHGHRLLGAVVGLLAILLAVVVCLRDERRWMRIAALLVVIMVIAQGVLGGMRVRWADERLAMVHGITGPMFFAYCVVLWSMTSRAWRAGGARIQSTDATRLYVFSAATAALALAQVILGAKVRHVPSTAGHEGFRIIVLSHVVVAVLLLTYASISYWRVRRTESHQPWLRVPALVLPPMLVVQIVLGAATWLVKYSMPPSLAAWAAGYTIEAEGIVQALTVTGHVATGSLILAVSALLATSSLRFVVREWTAADRSVAIVRAIP